MKPIRRVLAVWFVVGVLPLFPSEKASAEPWIEWRNTLQPAGESGPELTLACDGRTDYVIVVPERPTSQDAKAAEDLARWLKGMTGAEFPVVPDTMPSQTGEICIGANARLASLGKPATDLGDEGYLIDVAEQRLFLTGGSKRGAINAVYAFLEEDLGCRWYAGEGSTLPQRPSLVVRPVPRRFVPQPAIRDPFYRVAFDGTWSLRNRTNAPDAVVPEEWGGHVDYALFVHTFNTLMPPDEYFEAHPEYYMLDDEGKRTPRQLCTTNPDTIRIVTERVLRILKEKPSAEIICVSKNDGGGTCVCPSCKALDDVEGTNAAALLVLVNGVAEAVEREFPKVTVTTLAYLETVKPPKTVRPRPNVAIRLCTDNCMWSHPFTPAEEVPAFKDAMLGWAAIHDRIHIWDYCVNFSHYTAPMPNLDAIARNIRFFTAHHAQGVMEQGAYQSPGAERDLLRAWVFAKLMWDPSRDVEALTQDFIWGYFGKAAPAIARYDALLQEVAREHSSDMATPAGGIRYAMDAPFLSKAFIDEAALHYAEAATLAENEEIHRRVERDELPILYVQLCRGPEFVGEGYVDVLDRFEAIARREGLTHIYEGSPDLEDKLRAWREAASRP